MLKKIKTSYNQFLNNENQFQFFLVFIKFLIVVRQVLQFYYIMVQSVCLLSQGTATCDDLTKYLERVYDKRALLDLKCRKLEALPLGNPSRPSWYCVDARRH